MELDARDIRNGQSSRVSCGINGAVTLKRCIIDHARLLSVFDKDGDAQGCIQGHISFTVRLVPHKSFGRSDLIE